QGTVVAELQAVLKLLGYYQDAVNGVYQASTATAVSAFQQAAGLAADGIVGPETWGRLLPAAPIANTATEANAPPLATAPTVTAASVSQSSNPQTSAGAAATANPDSNSADSQATANTASANTTNTAVNPAPTPQPTGASSAPIELPILRIGARGPAVAQLQTRLQSLKVYTGAIDGIFGPETQAAVKSAQSSNQLTPDGIVGAATWNVLLR
ncbi:MAG: peptidoglycan-binding protein, partial [Cyanothece sp. SIO1E1]|nr:peptidoglycan-binding protein [Cyanothece sp. SIO1E1]